MLKKILLTICIILGLSACAASDKTISEDSPEQLYTQAKKLFDEKEYEKSALMFDEVERQHPYSVWAARSQIMMAYAYYQANMYDEAVLALDRFIQLHPGNKNTPYAYYLKGLCYFEQISDVGREQKMSADALETFERLVAFYPKSVYVSDAKAKIVVIYDQLAGKEMAVGRYYLKQHEFIPAINRFQTVLKEYPNTNQVPEALYRLAAAYVSLGMKESAVQINKRLNREFPDNSWTKKVNSLMKKVK